MARVTRMATCHPETKHFAKGLCKKCYDSAYAKSLDRIELNAQKRDWAKKNPERARAAHRKYLYGADAAAVEAMLKSQNYKCQICRTGEAKHLDHCHATGKIRGMLCPKCNQGLGYFKDNREALLDAVRYLGYYEDGNWDLPDYVYNEQKVA